MYEVVSLYISLLPVIVAGVVNAAFCHSKIFAFADKPIDDDKKFVDGRRIFGDSKTVKGFAGYVLFSMIFTVVWGFICAATPYLESHNFFYATHANSVMFNLWIGFLLGFAWALFELPNSFLKRRLNIKSSQGATGAKGVIFAILDQADSIFGVVLVIAIFYPISVMWYFAFVAIGAATHLLFNFLLFAMKLRKRPV